jgi:putative addiction module component (TIGR02574 family)
MTEALSSLFTSAMQLPDESRLELVELLIPTIRSEPSLEAEQFIEVNRRVDDVRAGRVQTLSGERVFREIEQALAAKRNA